MTKSLVPETAPTEETPLESWKEIAAYMQRDVSTLKRWEKGEGLPVRRHLHQVRSSVYAYPSELDGWWAQRRPADRASASMTWVERRPVRAVALAAMLLLTLAAAGDGLVLRPSSLAADDQGQINRLVWAGPQVDVLGAPSPDGSYIAITDWETGNLAIRELSGGVMRHLTDNGNWQGFAESPVPSPDGKQIAYAWFGEGAQRDLRVYSLETSSSSVVYARGEVELVIPHAWTPDGTRILAVLTRADRATQIALIGPGDGSVRVLKTMDWRAPHKLALSPDGRYVAYDFPPTAESPERDIFLLAADGSRDELLMEHPDDDVVLGWTPDGRNLLFGSERTGRMGIWALPMADGEAMGSPTLLRSDLPLLWAMGVTGDGCLYYGVRTGMSNVLVATLDATTGAVLSSPAPLTTRFVGQNRSPDWSRDGGSVAYVSQREFPPRSTGWMGGTIVVRSLANRDEREITPRLASMGRLVRWSPDGRSFLVKGQDVRGRTGLFTLSAETGEETLVVGNEPGGSIGSPAWAPDGRSVFYLHTTPEASNRLRVRNLETGEDHEVVGRSISRFVLSPDGRSLAVCFRNAGDVLAIVSIRGGETKELLQVLPPNALPMWSGMAWAPDGKHILFAQATDATRKQPLELWRIPVEGGSPQKTGLSMKDLRDLRVHPDGQRIVFTAGQDDYEIWVMDGLVQALAQ